MFEKIAYDLMKEKSTELVQLCHEFGIDYAVLVFADADDHTLVEYLVVDYPEEMATKLDDQGFEAGVERILGASISVGGIMGLPPSALIEFSKRSEVLLDDTHLRR